MAYETAAEKVQMRIADALERIASAVEESNYRAGAQERAQLASSAAWKEATIVAAASDGAQDVNFFTLPNLPTNEA